MKRPTLFAAVLGVILVSGGCGGSDAPATASDPARSGASGGAASTVEATGDVVEIKMMSAPGQGEVFEPANVTVKRGDLVRFVLVSGVHNANFIANRNPSGVKLPAASPYLQAPGQTYEFVVEQPNGEYFYQCDPHVAMGMTGTMTVTD
jgi:plastocyanin